MNWNDRPNFAAKMLEVATLLGVVVDEEDVGAFFRHLEDYPYDVVCAAIDRAIKDRDPSDEFLRRAMLTLPEIMGAIDNIVKETSTEGPAVAECKVCNGDGWLLSHDAAGFALSHPCECLYKLSLKGLARKKRPGSQDARMDELRKQIIAAYEYHQKKWGPASDKDAEEER